MGFETEILPDFMQPVHEQETLLQVAQNTSWRKQLFEIVESRMVYYSFAKNIRDKIGIFAPYWELLMSFIQGYFAQILAILSIFFLFWLYRVLLTNRKKEKPSPRSRSDTLRSQKSSNSHDIDRDIRGESSLLHPTNWDRISNQKDAMRASGTAAKTLRYETWSPPTPWTEVSKNLLPSSMNRKPRISQVAIELFPVQGKVRIDNIKGLVCITNIQIHVQNAKAAVLELFIDGKETEHTFSSSRVAAQFQRDLLYLQVAGDSIMNMYHSLELVNQGSIAYDGKEPVLHDSVCDEELAESGVAWDDVYRCLGTAFPKLKDQLERQIGTQPGNETTEEDGVISKMTTQYFNKRKLLGQIDFFRLFCPILQSSCKPQQESNPRRLEDLMKLRKLVAETSVHVHSYLRAQLVINQGWKREWSYKTCSRRMAYDDDFKNAEHDNNATNEYYEATVSRDIQYYVKSLPKNPNGGQSHLLGYQTYALVDSHVFQLQQDDSKEQVLTHSHDPIKEISSLRQIVESNPDLDFFCIGFFLQTPGIASISLFVRTLPKSIDSHIDYVHEQYAYRDSSSRNKMFDILIQLGPCQKLSSFLRAGVNTVSFLFPYSSGEGKQIPLENGGIERSQFSCMTLAKHTEMNHFGGSLQTNSDLPNNYLAVTACVDSSQTGNLIFPSLYRKFENEILPKSVVDFTFVLKSGDEIYKVPERALCTLRMVHCNLADSALPIELATECEEKKGSFSGYRDDLNQERDKSLPNRTRKARSSRVFRFLANGRSMSHAEKTKLNRSFQRKQSTEEKNDPFGTGVDTLIEILQDVRVPIRRCNIVGNETEFSTLLSEAHTYMNLPPSIGNSDVVSFRVLQKLNRDDLLRFYQGSGCDLKIAAVRVVNSAAWRGMTFPIDTQTCRVELQSGQFFHQGEDYKGNAVFYFRNMCVGPWRGDDDAVINAVLHRLESSLQKLSTQNSNIKITLVVLLGRPLFRKKRREKAVKDDEMNEIFEEDEDGGSRVSLEWDPLVEGANPRLQPGEKYHAHSNKTLLLRLVELLLRHYPERLYKAIFVPGQGHSYGYFSTAVATQMAISSNIHETRTRAKCFVLHRPIELQEFIPLSQLVTIAGGNVPLYPSVFEC